MLLRYWPHLLGGLVIIGLVALVWSHFAKDARTEGALKVLAGQANEVLIRTRDGAENPKLTWELVPGQIVALGESNKRLKGEIETQNQTIAEWANEAAARKADAEEWRQIAAKAEAQRASALRTLGRAAVTPGARDDMMLLIQQAEEASDLARENGA